MKPFLIFISFFFSVFCLFPSEVFAKVWINEFSSSSSEDWIEVFNDGQEVVILDQYRIRDDSSSNSLDLNGQISPLSYRVFEWGSKLNNNGDTIKIVSKNDENLVIDQIIYGVESDVSSPESGQSAGRQTDGGSGLVVFTSPSKNASNAHASIAPTTTPIPENTPTPTREPTPTRVPTPTRIPTPTKSPTTKPIIDDETDEEDSDSVATTSKSKIKTVNISGVPTPILGLATKSATPKTTGRIAPKSTKQILVKNAVSPPYFILASGIVFIAACAILIFQRRRKNRHETDN